MSAKKAQDRTGENPYDIITNNAKTNIRPGIKKGVDLKRMVVVFVALGTQRTFAEFFFSFFIHRRT